MIAPLALIGGVFFAGVVSIMWLGQWARSSDRVEWPR